MQPHDSEVFFDRLAALGELFDAKVSPVKAALYFDALKDLPLDDVLGALNAAVKVSVFMPKPAELRRIVVGDDEDHTERAWMALRSAMHSVGAYASVVMTDAAMGESVLSLFGSWSAACLAEFSPEMWTAKRKEFGRVYRALRDRHLVGARYLLGMAERQNTTRGELDSAMWKKYITVGVIESNGAVRQLRGNEAEDYRMLLSARANELQQIAGADVAAMSESDDWDLPPTESQKQVQATFAAIGVTVNKYGDC